LLAFHEGREEDTKDGRFIFPAFTVQASENLDPAASAVEDDLDTSLSNAVNAYNANPSAATAAPVATFARDLEEVLRELVNDDLTLEGFTGLAVTEPSDWEGGAFYFGFRVVGIGSSTVSQDDLNLLNSYIEGMEILANGGSLADLPTNILDANGGLIDPTTSFSSSADVALLGLSEWGVSLSTSFEFFGQQFSVGATPKVLRAIAYREATEFDGEALSYSDTKRTYTAMNLDVGVAAMLGDNFRMGLAIKDLVPEEYDTGSGLALDLKPRTRFGVAWVDSFYTLGLDYDVNENKSAAGERPVQDLSLGFEISPLSYLDVQLGYRHDITGFRDDVLSGGVALSFRGMSVELSYAESNWMQGASLQFGWAF